MEARFSKVICKSFAYSDISRGSRSKVSVIKKEQIGLVYPYLLGTNLF